MIKVGFLIAFDLLLVSENFKKSANKNFEISRYLYMSLE